MGSDSNPIKFLYNYSGGKCVMEYTEILNAKEGSVIRNYESDLHATTEYKIFNVELQSNYETGQSASAVYGKLDYKATGTAGGQAQAITAEVVLRDGARTGGNYSAIDLEIGGGASTSFGEGFVTFIRCGVWGAGAVSNMDDNGLLMDIQGLADADGHLYSTGTPETQTGSLKIRVGTNVIYLMTTGTPCTT